LVEEKLIQKINQKNETNLLISERQSNAIFTEKTSNLPNDNADNNFKFDRSSVLIKSEPKSRSILYEELYNNSNNDSNQNKSADKEEANKKDFTFLEIFQKLKKERKIIKSTNFFQKENILSNSITNHDTNIKTIGCQTESNWEENNMKIENVLNTKVDFIHTEELYEGKIHDNLENNEIFKANQNINLVDFGDFITKIENFKKKIHNEKNLIDNIYNTKINNNNIISEKKDFINKEETKIDSIVSQLDFLVNDFKEHTKKLNNQKSITNNNKDIYKRQTLDTKEKFIQFDVDEMQKKLYSEYDEKMFEEKRKHENEKKTILKVLEEKCEKFNILEIENGDLKSKIKSLEVKMSPDEKINKKLLVKLEQNIEQLNLMLETTSTEKSQLAINIKVFLFYFKILR